MWVSFFFCPIHFAGTLAEASMAQGACLFYLQAQTSSFREVFGAHQANMLVLLRMQSNSQARS